jgi:hypothetical protein
MAVSSYGSFSQAFINDLNSNFGALSDAIQPNPATVCATLVDLKALTTRPESVLVKGKTAANDGWGGVFAWVAGDTTEADDQDVVQPTAGPAGRYQRLGQSYRVGSFNPTLEGGNQTGTLPWIGWKIERNRGQISSDMHGIWPASNTLALFGVSELADSASDPVGAVADQGPRFSFIIDTSTTTSVLDSVGLAVVNIGGANGARVVGQNIVVGHNVGVSGGRLTGLEIDVQSAPGATASYAEGIQIQSWSTTYDQAQRITANGAGKFNIGYDFSPGVYVTAAIKLGNDNGINKHRLQMAGTAATPGEIYVNSSNQLIINSPGPAIMGAASVHLGNGGGTTNFIQVDQATAGNSPFLKVTANSDANVNLNFGAYGSGALNFYTGFPSPVAQAQITHTPLADRTILLTGSNGGNPMISASAGSLAVGSPLLFSSTVGLANYTVATLPVGVTGSVARVTDGAAALAWGATVTGGGTAQYLVWYNGAAWTVVGR